jgi:hypothetical protein
MVVSFTRIQSMCHFLMNQILICYCHSKIFEIFLISKGPIGYIYVVILTCILATKHEHMHLLLDQLLPSVNQSFCVFLYGIYIIPKVHIYHQHRPTAEVPHLFAV